jgi:AcrR family transcriptional regulator
MPKGIPLTEEEQMRRRREIFNAALHLFLDKGFNETSMREIAEAAGVGKSTLYDYFVTKDDILLSVVEEEVQGLVDRARQIASQPVGPQEKILQIVQDYLNYLTTNEVFFVRLSLEVQRLASASQARIQAKRHAYQEVIRAVIDEGIQAGCYRPIDSLLAARVLLSISCQWCQRMERSILPPSRGKPGTRLKVPRPKFTAARSINPKETVSAPSWWAR